MTAKSATERSDALRARRKAQGLKRLEIYAHPEDWPAIRKEAERLRRKRERAIAKESKHGS